MDAALASAVGVNAPVWVWDGCWWRAVVIDMGPKKEFLVVRFEHGVSAPILLANIRFRDPNLRGADKPPEPAPREMTLM